MPRTVRMLAIVTVLLASACSQPRVASANMVSPMPVGRPRPSVTRSAPAVAAADECREPPRPVPPCVAASRLVPTVAIAAGASAVATGGAHTCAVMDDGTLECWGANQLGQLGDGTRQTRPAPTKVAALAGVRAVALGGGHTCALLRDGTVWCFGANERGQLGDGTTTLRTTPVRALGIADAVALAVGWQHGCAALRDGTVRCWGANDKAQLGDDSACVVPPPSEDPWAAFGDRQWGTSCRWPDQPTPVPVAGVADVVQLVAGTSFTCAGRTRGAVLCWGSSTGWREVPRPSPLAIEGTAGAVALAGDSSYACALLRRGPARCWRLPGRPPASHVHVGPHEIPSGTTALALSWAECAVTHGGALLCSGNNLYGQLGDGTRDHRFAYAPVAGLSRVRAVALGPVHACALAEPGCVYCWGDNTSGQVGDGTVSCVEVSSEVESSPEPGACSPLSDAVLPGPSLVPTWLP